MFLARVLKDWNKLRKEIEKLMQLRESWNWMQNVARNLD